MNMRSFEVTASDGAEDRETRLSGGLREIVRKKSIDSIRRSGKVAKRSQLRLWRHNRWLEYRSIRMKCLSIDQIALGAEKRTYFDI